MLGELAPARLNAKFCRLQLEVMILNCTKSDLI